jgi:hypothetical protein
MKQASPANDSIDAPDQEWSNGRWAAILVLLALATILIHGFHPFSEDGGLYAAGVEYTLSPKLFLHYTVFVTEHLRFSLFAPAIALLVRLAHLSLPAALLLVAFASALATMAAARALLRRCVPDNRAQLAGLALLAAGWTLPVAGTSLYLMDPYVTARSLTMPLSLLAMAYALDRWPAIIAANALRHPALRCAACFVLAAAFHPLMAAYALLFVAALRATRSTRPLAAWTVLTTILVLLCISAGLLAPPESSAETAAVITRYYWFLSQWQWYERLGLLGPPMMLIISLILHRRSCHPERSIQNCHPERSIHNCHPERSEGSAFCRVESKVQETTTFILTAILLSILTTVIALLFAHESSPTHTVARLQPLREFLLLYAGMLLLLGAAIAQACQQAALKTQGVLRLILRSLPIIFTTAMAAGLFLAARAIYPDSPHIELPCQSAQQQNPWVRAFLWTRDNTPPDALFALDARYVNTDGEDAQTFRAISLRSALPDYSKDGGEASITPSIAPIWQAAAQAQANLSALTDTERDDRLAPFAPTWIILHADAKTAHPCPYSNATVKVCHLR